MTHPERVPSSSHRALADAAKKDSEDGWRERAAEAVAMMLQAIHDGEWTPEDTDDGDPAMAIARKAVALTEAELLETYRPC